MAQNASHEVAARAPNWLPLPGAEIDLAPQVVDENDLFPKGFVTSYYPQQGLGLVKNDRGEEISFSLAEVDLIGPKGHRKFLSEGCRVGYDISCTSHGPRVSKIKVY